MNEDLIRREDAYTVLSEYYHHKTEMQHKALREALDRVPSAEPESKWIPCGERLPEENMWTICQNNAGAMMIGKYDIEYGWMFPAYFDGIVAWQPRPEPWKGEDDA